MLAKKYNHHVQAKMLFLCSLILTWEFSFPFAVLAQDIDQVLTQEMSQVVNVSRQLDSTKVRVMIKQPKRVIKVVATAYSSSVEETDDTPCITANGFNVCTNNKVNVIAANFLPFGTKIKIPELYGDHVLLVQDRMNARYGYGRIDIWHPTKAQAVQFGAKYIKIEIY